MPQFLKSKHQRLILQCYPPGRDLEKKPNSSELSYLLYYASTRRVKLEKVGNFIEKKTLSDVQHYSKYGNVQVSLLIIDNLINKCTNNLNVFANNIFIIFKSILNVSNDLILCQLSLKVFKNFCSYLDYILFVGNIEFTENFMEVSNLFLNLGQKNYNSSNSDNNNNQWKIISIKAAKYLSSVVNIDFGDILSHSSSKNSVKTFVNNNAIADKSITLLLDTLHKQFNTVEMHAKLRIAGLNNSNPDGNISPIQTNLKRSSSLKRSLSNAPVANDDETDLDLDIVWTDLECAEEALGSLKVYFQNINLSGMRMCMASISSFFDKNCKEAEFKDWASSLTLMIVNWVPVQLRFMVLSYLIEVLTNQDKGSDSQILLTYLVSELLSADINMIGLSILDILRSLLNFQAISVTSKDESGVLNANLKACIRNLMSHIYYNDQLSDIIDELFYRFAHIRHTGESVDFEVSLLLDDIENVLFKCVEGSPQGELMTLFNQQVSTFICNWIGVTSAAHDVPLSVANLEKCYTILYELLSIKLGYFKLDFMEFDQFYQKVTNLGDFSIYYKTEVSSSSEFLHELVLDIIKNVKASKHIFDLLINISASTIRVFGVNFIATLANSWDSLHEKSPTFSLFSLHYSLQYLLSRVVHEEESENDITVIENLDNRVLSAISQHKSNGTWELVSDNLNTKSANGKTSPITKAELLTAFEETNYTKKWIVNVLNASESGENSVHATSGYLNTNSGHENSSILSITDLVANLTNNNTIISNFTGSNLINNGNSSINGNGTAKNFPESSQRIEGSSNGYTSLRVSDLKNAAFKETSQITNEQSDQAIIQLKNAIQSLTFNKDKFNEVVIV